MENLRSIVRKELKIVISEVKDVDDALRWEWAAASARRTEQLKHKAYQTLYNAIEYIRSNAIDQDDYDPVEVLIGVYSILNKWEIEEG